MPNVYKCTSGVGCEVAGVCYAEAHGLPEQCGAPASRVEVNADDLHADLMADLREVFDVSDPETSQSTRDVIEYVDSWLSVFAQKTADNQGAPEAPEPPAQQPQPIDMVLHCPACGMQHVDAPEPGQLISGGPSAGRVRRGWDNPPHRSHLCHGCSHVWRPADVPTNGVAAVKTAGRNDSPPNGATLLQECAAGLREAVRLVETDVIRCRPVDRAALLEALAGWHRALAKFERIYPEEKTDGAAADRD